MSSENTTLYAGIVIALIIGAAVGYFVYPSMNPGPTSELVDKADYDAVVADLEEAEAKVEDAEAQAAEAEAQIAELTAPKKIGIITGTGGLGDKSFNDI